MKGKNEPLIDDILKAHGAREDLTLWRNATASAWVGPFVTRTEGGGVMLGPGSTRIQAGLCEGSADLIGILRDRMGRGRFVALEVKQKGTRTTRQQKRFLAHVQAMGGIGAIVRSVEDVNLHLGEPK